MHWDLTLLILDVVIFIRAFYLLAAVAIIIVRLTPPLQNRFLDYGARNLEKGAESAPNSINVSLLGLLDFLAQLQISHSRFGDFYVLSLLCLAFWLSQIYTGGAALEGLSQSVPHRQYDASPARIYLCFLLLIIQSLRRLYECLTLSKPSTKSPSSMWIGHYFIGLAFYFFINIAIFIEDTHVLLNERSTQLAHVGKLSVSILDVLALLAFIITSIQQHWCHQSLASLKKYTLPDQYAFKYIVAPHYTTECGLYLYLSVLSAPIGHLINWTVFCAFIFVVVNLGVTADGTKRWMLRRFPDREHDIQSRWRMIPLVF